MSKYPEYKNLNLPSIGKEILDWWEKENIFEKSISSREGKEPFVFYEGPPSANGMPGIHHVMARTIKDLFCRYQTLKGKQVKRKAGWDTHGLPIELAVEKTLGITKEDIGKKISIEDYNKECRREVMQYQDKWEELTRMMGYWVDMEHPYITYENNYIESVWWLLKKLYDKKLLYKGYTIQPYSPAAGTGLSTHELNQPGCYRNVKDKTAVAMFKLSEKSKGKIQKLINSDRGVNLGKGLGILDDEEIFFLAWTTTPWTLPANMALAVGKEINYIAVETFHPYPPKTKEFKQDIIVVLAKDLICNILNAQQLEKYIIENLLKGKLLTNKKDIGADGEYIDDNGESILVEVKNKILQREDVFKLIARIKEVDDKEKELHIVCKGYDDDAKIFIEKTIQEHKVPFKLSTVKELIDKTNQPVFKGEDLVDIKYEQLLPYVNRENWNDVAFRVIAGDFVSTEDGTGIVHIAPTFGADDMRAAKEAGISSMLVVYEETKGFGPIVDQRGRYRPQITDFAGEYVKADYLSESEKSTETVRLSNLQGSALNDLISKIVKRTNEYLSVDERIVLKLELDGKLFKKETYEHNYPHCWRTDKPILYYPLDSWFVKVTEKKDEMIRLNKEINWKPEHTGTGRFGEWLNNLQDWNLSRSRFWGIPLPIWRNVFADKKICIGSFADFEKEDFFDDLWNEKIKGKWFYRGKRFDEWMSKIHSQNNDTIQEFKNSIESFIGQKSISDEATRNFINTTLQNISNNSENIFYNSPCNLLEKYLDKLNLADFDFHKPFVDRIIFIEEIENQLPRVYLRESDLIDVWFDSGAMPYAQWHYPFENKEMIDKHKAFPADFIAEGVDQTRGWFYTLHAIAALCFDSVAYKNVVSNGLVLDKNGNKMSKRLGNAVDPFSTLEKYGPDAVRWYMVTNADPWDNLKFDIEGVAEKQRSFFGTFYNTYAFFALYANIDKFVFAEKEIPLKDKSEIDRWILSELNSLIKIVDESYSSYEPTKAGRAIEYFVDEHLSNWYVRLCRRRFWKGEYTQDKISAYQTLYRCLEVVAQLSSPIAPFFCEKLFKNLNDITGRQKTESVHLSLFPKTDESTIDKPLEERMEMAQKISSMVLSIRKKENIRVRQPLTKIRVPILDDSFKKKLEAVKDLILSEVNVKEIEYVSENDTQIVKNIKLNFKTLGKKYGKYMKAVQEYAKEHEQIIINSIERENEFEIPSAFIGNEVTIKLLPEDVEIIPVDIPGWKVANSGALTVALDITITDKLRDEGIAREIVNRIQNLRKDNKFEVTDRIEVKVKNHPKINSAIINNLDYIRAEILANKFEIVNEINGNGVEIEVDDEIKTMVTIDRIKQLN